MHAFFHRWLLSLCVLFVPAAVYGQASITGVVRDSSGAVLPGVNVEAASPALIEKVRSVVTDGTGQYRIVDLRPGVYTVTFTLPGFSVVKRDGVEVSGGQTFTINAELRVGGVQETITVVGETPVPNQIHDRPGHQGDADRAKCEPVTGGFDDRSHDGSDEQKAEVQQ